MNSLPVQGAKLPAEVPSRLRTPTARTPTARGRGQGWELGGGEAYWGGGEACCSGDSKPPQRHQSQ